MSDFRRMAFMAVSTILGCTVCSGTYAAITTAERIGPKTEIPANFSSWSLFLICNPEWILQNGDLGVQLLHKQFLVFGQAIGKRNAAIWFFENEAAAATVENTDISRSSAYCEKYKLLPSNSPYVLVTTRHPDAGSELGNHLVIRLNGLNTYDSARVLSKLTDQLLITKLSASELNETRAGWRRVLNAFRTAIIATGCYFNKVSVAVNAGAVHAEIAHDDKCGPLDSRPPP
jgi:hypothetical protein